VADWYQADYYKSSPYRNPKAERPLLGGWHVTRGGAYMSEANVVRCAYRGGARSISQNYTAGFRIAVAAQVGAGD